MSDVTSYIVNRILFEATGKMKIDLDKLHKVGSHQTRDPFNSSCTHLSHMYN